MTPAQKTVAILGLAGAVAGGTALLVPQTADSRAVTTRDPAPQLSAKRGSASASGFTVAAQMDSDYVLRGGESYLAVTVTAPKVKSHERPPVDIAVVMDRSGSMAGEKLEHAKLAADRLLAQLSAEDRFTIISYGTDVDVVYPLSLATEGHVSSAQRALLQVHDDGGTNLSGGLIAARGQLSGARDRRDEGRLKRVVLISDGKANEGIIGAGPLAQLAGETATSGTSLTTVGVGLDYDEQVMTRMAVSGRGNYYFIESAAGLRTMFTKELGDLGKTTATDVAIQVKPATGVRIVEAFGHELHAMGDGSYRFPIADLYSGDTRKLVLRVRTNIDAGTEALISGVDVKLVTTEGSKAIALTTEAHATSTDDASQVAAHRNAESTPHIERARTAAAINEATALYEQGRAEDARRTLTVRRSKAREIAKSIGNQKLDSDLSAATEAAEGNFGSAGWDQGASPSPKAKRARKANRYDAYKLAK